MNIVHAITQISLFYTHNNMCIIRLLFYLSPHKCKYILYQSISEEKKLVLLSKPVKSIMFRRIIIFSIEQKPIVIFFVLILIGFGIYSMKQLPVYAFPIAFLLIFTTIPISAIAGIFLISCFRQLPMTTIKHIYYHEISASFTPFRPVFMIALGHILGFFLKKKRKTVAVVGLLLMSGISPVLFAQDSTQINITIQQAVDSALQNNFHIQSAKLRAEQAKVQKSGAWNFNPTEFTYQSGQINSLEKDYYLEINQNFGSILTHINTYRRAKTNAALQNDSYAIIQKQIIAETKSAYQFWQYVSTIAKLKEKEAALYIRLADIAELRYDAGDITLLDKSIALTKMSEVTGNYYNALDEVVLAGNKLNQLMLTKVKCIPYALEPELYRIDKLTDTSSYKGDVYISYYNKKYALTKIDEGIAKSKYFPEITAGVFSQEIESTPGFFGWQIGVAVPLWIPANQSEIKQARIESDIVRNELEFQKYKVATEIDNLLYELNKYFRQIRHFQDVALFQAEILLKTADSQLNVEEIDFNSYVQSVSLSFRLQEQYFEVINNYNQTALQLEIYGDN